MATTWTQDSEAGGAWDYNDINLTYNEDTDDSGLDIFYNGNDSKTTWTNESEV